MYRQQKFYLNYTFDTQGSKIDYLKKFRRNLQSMISSKLGRSSER